MASSFDPELIYQAGQFLAREARSKSASILLGPTVNIQRSPLGGRAFESFSEDPVLSGVLAGAYVRGLQEEGVSGCIKHFVANEYVSQTSFSFNLHQFEMATPSYSTFTPRYGFHDFIFVIFLFC